MKLRFKYNVPKWLMRGFRGTVMFYPFVLFTNSKEDVPDWLFRHELEHIYQIQRMGLMMFYIKYLFLLIKHGYLFHPFEMEAVQTERIPLTDKERTLKDSS